MPSPYPIEIRTRVIEKVEGGMKIIEVSRLFKIHRETISTWKKRKAEIGSVKAKEGYQKGYGHKIKNLEEFRVFVEKNNSCSLSELAKRWKEEVSERTIGRRLKKIRYSYKKNILSSKKRHE